jgi:hypothetical protein
VNSWTDRNYGRGVLEGIMVVDDDVVLASIAAGCDKSDRADVMLVEKEWSGKGY